MSISLPPQFVPEQVLSYEPPPGTTGDGGLYVSVPPEQLPPEHGFWGLSRRSEAQLPSEHLPPVEPDGTATGVADSIVVVTGQIVVYHGVTIVVTDPIGQYGTVGGHEVMTMVLVAYTTLVV
jgi:hypothetical protein